MSLKFRLEFTPNEILRTPEEVVNWLETVANMRLVDSAVATKQINGEREYYIDVYMDYETRAMLEMDEMFYADELPDSNPSPSFDEDYDDEDEDLEEDDETDNV